MVRAGKSKMRGLRHVASPFEGWEILRRTECPSLCSTPSTQKRTRHRRGRNLRGGTEYAIQELARLTGCVSLAFQPRGSTATLLADGLNLGIFLQTRRVFGGAHIGSTEGLKPLVTSPERCEVQSRRRMSNANLQGEIGQSSEIPRYALRKLLSVPS